MNPDLRLKLKKYAISAGAVVATSVNSDAQIIHSDPDPDINVLGIGNSYLLDLNDDGTDDFSFYIFSSTDTLFNGTYWAAHAVKVTPLNQNAVAGSSSSGYPYAFYNGIPVNSNLLWYFNDAQVLAFAATMGTFTFGGGNWNIGQDFYLGLRLNINMESFYGWARLNVGSLGEFTIYDYAVLTNPDSTIHTGDTTAVGPIVQCRQVQSPEAYDDYNNGNGSDIRVKFYPPYNPFGDPYQLGIEEYRVIFMKSPDADSFSLADAQAVSPANYVNIQPEEVTYYEFYLDSNATDKDGDPLAEQQPYKFFVMSKADGVYAHLDTLSYASPEITLEYIVPIPADTARNIVLTDVADHGNEKDLRVNFDPAANPSGVWNYKVMIVKAEDVSGFNIEKADSLTAGYYERYVLLSTWENQCSLEWRVCVDGDSIRPGIPYVAFVMSMPDYDDADTPALSSPSNEITLMMADTMPDTTAALLPISTEQSFYITVVGERIVVESGDHSPVDHVKLYMWSGSLIDIEPGRKSTVELAIQDLPSGVYMLEVRSKGSSYFSKVFIHSR